MSKEYSPQEIVSGQKMYCNKHCNIDFGKYCEVHDEPEPTNTTKIGNQDVIAIGQTENIQGSYNVLILSTGHKLNRCTWNKTSIDKSAITKVENLSKKNTEVEVENYQIGTTKNLILIMTMKNPLFYCIICIQVSLQRSQE